MKTWLSIVFIAFLAAPELPAQSSELSMAVTSSRDNTLYESVSGALSNGAGQHLIVGKTNLGGIRRAVVFFDLSESIPAGAIVDSVRVAITLEETISGAHNISLHRLSVDWGEGTSNSNSGPGKGAPSAANDATWIHTFFNSATWTTAGGDFNPNASATRSVSGPGRYNWASAGGLATDVQTWIDSPASNHGWIVIGNEAVNGSAKGFFSREHPSAASRPILYVYYSQPTFREVAEVPDESPGLAAYPNPFSRSVDLTVDVPEASEARIRVVDLMGRTVYEAFDGFLMPGEQRLVVDLAPLAAGMYFVRLESPGSVVSRPIIKIE